MEEKSIKIEIRENILIAAGFDAYRTSHVLFQYLGYRKRIAEQLLSEHNSGNTKILFDLYEHINHQIKMIIGIQ